MVILRPAAADDEGFLYALFAQTRAGELALGQWDTAQAAALLQLQYRAQQQSYRQQYPAAATAIVLAPERDGPAEQGSTDDKGGATLLGGAAVGQITIDRSGAEIVLVDIALLPAWQGQGIGTGLIAALQAEAAAGGRAIRLHVLATSRARWLYQRVGFLAQGEPGVYQAMIWPPSTQPAPPAQGA